MRLQRQVRHRETTVPSRGDHTYALCEDIHVQDGYSFGRGKGEECRGREIHLSFLPASFAAPSLFPQSLYLAPVTPAHLDFSLGTEQSLPDPSLRSCLF